MNTSTTGTAPTAAPSVLVTGGAGFIGAHYVRALAGAADGTRVTVLDALTYAGDKDRLPLDQVDFVHGDVCDAPLVDRLVAAHEHVVHLAAESHVDRSLTDPARFVRTNVLGTQTVLDAAARHGRRVVVTSTDEVYGSIAHGAWTEDAPLAPNSPYSASKAAADLLALAAHRSHGLDVRITRAANTYGSHQYPEKIIPRFVARLLTGRDVPLYGDGRNVREWLHVDDHVRALDLVRRHGRPGEVYHVAGGTELTNRQLTEALLGLLGAGTDRITHVPDRKGHDLRYALDGSKIRTELGFAPERDFTAGLRATVDWYVRNRAWWSPRLDD